jgi:transposase InsO family protein
MSLNSADTQGSAGSGAGGAAIGAAADRAPRLQGAAQYAQWRAQTEVFLAQRGVGDALRKSRTTTEWDGLVARVAQFAEDDEVAALLMLDGKTSSSSSSTKEKTQTGELDAATKEARQIVRGIVARSERAFGYLYGALPEEIRPQVEHLPQGFAYGLWRWIEEKYQSKESDNVNALLAEWSALEQSDSESFDAYRARVNKLADLLGGADERPSSRSFSYTLLEKLRPHYKPVVLALHNGPALKQTKEIDVPAQKRKVLDIDWLEITRQINAHERSEQRLSGAEGQSSGEHQAAMSARQYHGHSSSGSSSSSGGGQHQSRQQKAGHQLPPWNEKGEPRCYNCNQYGHMGKACSKPKNKNKKPEPQSPTPGEGEESAQSAVSVSLQPTESDREREYCLCVREVSLSPQMETAMVAEKKNSQPAAARSAATATSAQSSAVQQKKTYASAASSSSRPASSPAARAGAPPSAAGAAAAAASAASAAPKKSAATNALGSISLDKALATSVWGIDTMASTHVSGNRQAFGALHRQAEIGVKVANGEIVRVAQVGTVPLKVKSAEGRVFRTAMESVWYSPEFSNNLLSWGRLRNEGWKLQSSKDGGDHLTTPKGTKIPLQMVNRVMTMSTGDLERVYAMESATAAPTVTDSATTAVMRAHQLLGHMGVTTMQKIYGTECANRVSGLPKLTVQQITAASEAVQACEACIKGKMARTPLSSGPTKPGHRGLDRGGAPGEVLHMDTSFIPFGHPEKGRVTEYGLTVTDAYTGAIYGAPIAKKSEIPAEVISIMRVVSTQTGRKVKRLRADGGSEFINQAVKDECTRTGTELKHSPRHEPRLNGIAERAGGLVKEMMLVMLSASGGTHRVWRRAYLHAMYVWNRTKISAQTNKTPYETMMSKKPDVTHLGVFGCDAWYHVEKQERGALEPKARACVYLGHDKRQDCATVYCLQTEKVLVRRDVKYKLDSFENMKILCGTASASDQQLSAADDIAAADDNSSSAPTPAADEQEYAIDRISGTRQKGDATQYRVHWTGYSKPTWEPREQLEDTAALEEYERELASRMTTRRSSARQKAEATVPSSGPEEDDDDDDSDDGDENETQVQMVMSAISAVSHSDNSEMRQAVATGIQTGLRRRAATPIGASSSESVKWATSRQAEIDACMRQGVWKDVAISDLPAGANVLPSKWVDKEKNDGRLKSRITPKGFKQREGVDFFETFAATAMYKTLRLMLSLVALWDYELVQADVPEAFLNAMLNETVYMQMPPGYERPGYVKLLLKALYGLRQAPMNWGKLIHGFTTKELGFSATQSDTCLYFLRSRTGRLMLLYRFVDDFEGGFHRDDRKEFEEAIEKLRQRFNIKVLPTTDRILGMRLTRDRAARTIKLDVEDYISKALEKYGLSECKAAQTPMSTTRSDQSEQTEQEQQPCDRQLYMEITGTVMYAACAARPDIAFAAHRLASNMQTPTERDMVAAKRVLRYLSGTRSIGLIFGGKSEQNRSAAATESRGFAAQQVSVCAYADADWASDKADRKSVTGWISKLNGDLISWSSKKQRTIALSTCEAELYAEAAAIQEVLWLRGMLKELGLRVETGSTIHGDNQSAIAVSKNGIKGERTKHIDIKYRFVTETIDSGKVQLKWIATTEQQADLFTKALAKPVHDKLRDQLMSVGPAPQQ